MMTLADMLTALVCMLQVFLIVAAFALLIAIFAVTCWLSIRWVVRRLCGN